MVSKWSKSPKLALWGSEYNGNGRAYVDPTDGDKRFPSVTTILKHEDKSDLVQWAATKVAERARDRPDIVMGDPDLVVNRLQYAHNDYRDERAEVGTGVHAKIQADHEGTWDFPDLDAEQLSMLDQWEKFCMDYDVTIIKSEFTIRGDGWMGTADLLIEYTDPFTGDRLVGLEDIKTSRKLWGSHDMQLSALANGLYILKEVPEGTKGAHRRKGRVKAEDSWWIREDMPHFDTLGKIHIREDFYDLVEIPENEINLHYEAFRCYLGVANVKEKLKEVRKS